MGYRNTYQKVPYDISSVETDNGAIIDSYLMSGSFLSNGIWTTGTNNNSPISAKYANKFDAVKVKKVTKRVYIGREKVNVQAGTLRVNRKTGQTYRVKRDYSYYRKKFVLQDTYAFTPKHLRMLNLAVNDLYATNRKYETFGSKTINAYKTVNGRTYTKSAFGNLGYFRSGGCCWPAGEIGYGGQTAGDIERNNISAALDSFKSSMLNQMQARVKSQSINLAQTLAESRESIDTLKNLFLGILKACLKLKKLQIKAALMEILPKDSKELAGQWLAVQYGIIPILNDIQGGLEALSKKQREEYFDIIVTRQVPEARTVKEINFSYGFAGRSTYIVESKGKIKLKVRVKMLNASTSTAASLGFTNPASLAYELIPFSFLVDTVYPIGTFLNGLDAFTGLQVVDAHWTKSIDVSVTEVFNIGGLDSDNFVWANANFGYKKDVNYRERVRIANPSSLTTPPAPEFRNPFSLKWFANVTALLRQLKK